MDEVITIRGTDWLDSNVVLVELSDGSTITVTLDQLLRAGQRSVPAGEDAEGEGGGGAEAGEG